MKKVISTILGFLFVIIVICAVFIGTYVFSKPSHVADTDSRELILGYWTDEDQDMRFYFDQSGEFTICKASDESHIFAEGYFKVNEKSGKIKLLIMPNKERDESFDFGAKLNTFATITYRGLQVEDVGFADKGWTFLNDIQREKIMNAKASCKFVFSNANENVYNCERTRTIKEFNGDEKSDTRINDNT